MHGSRPSRDEIEMAMRGREFEVEGVAIRFTEPCPEAAHPGSAETDSLTSARKR